MHHIHRITGSTNPIKVGNPDAPQWAGAKEHHPEHCSENQLFPVIASQNPLRGNLG
jgi:hypothetical protein